MFDVKIDTRSLNDAMALFAKETKKGLDEVVVLQSRTVVGHLIAITPPGKRRGSDFLNKKGYISNEAFKNAKKIITGGIARLFPTSAIKDEDRIRGMIEAKHKWKHGKGAKAVGSFANNLGELKRIHRQGRNPSTGRVNIGNNGQRMALTRTALKNQLKNELFLNIGILNSGWRKSYDKLKAPAPAMPAWIKRHPAGQGGIRFKISKTGLAVTLSNRVSYYPKDTIARIDQAVSRTKRGLEKQLEYMLKRKINNANNRMNR